MLICPNYFVSRASFVDEFPAQRSVKSAQVLKSGVGNEFFCSQQVLLRSTN